MQSFMLMPRKQKLEIAEGWNKVRALPPAKAVDVNKACGAIMGVFVKFNLNASQVQDVLKEVLKTNIEIDAFCEELDKIRSIPGARNED